MRMTIDFNHLPDQFVVERTVIGNWADAHNLLNAIETQWMLLWPNGAAEALEAEARKAAQEGEQPVVDVAYWVVTRHSKASPEVLCGFANRGGVLVPIYSSTGANALRFPREIDAQAVAEAIDPADKPRADGFFDFNVDAEPKADRGR